MEELAQYFVPAAGQPPSVQFPDGAWEARSVVMQVPREVSRNGKVGVEPHNVQLPLITLLPLRSHVIDRVELLTTLDFSLAPPLPPDVARGEADLPPEITVNLVSGLPMDTLIGGPLQAAASAQQGLAMTQSQYTLNTGFNQTKDASGQITYTPITASIAMGQSQPVIGTDGSVSTANSHLSVDFPIITMAPSPSLSVTSVDISFDMEVKSSYRHETDAETSSKTQEQGSFDAKAGWGCFSVEVKGSVSHDSSQSSSDKQTYEKSNDAKYHVEVKAEQQPIPEGIKMLLKMFGDNMTLKPITLNSLQPIPAPHA